MINSVISSSKCSKLLFTKRNQSSAFFDEGTVHCFPNITKKPRKLRGLNFIQKQLVAYKSNPILTPNLVAINFVILDFTSGIFTLSNTVFAKAYINNAFPSFFGIPRCCM